MAFNPDRLLARVIETPCDWSRKDTILYALGVGAHELPFVYEEQLVALPTMAAVLGYPGFSFWSDPEIGADTGMILHGETEVELEGPLPVEGALTGVNRVSHVFDKGPEKGAVVMSEREIRDETGALVATARNTTMLRGNGGFGGSAEGQPRPRQLPERAPDLVVDLATAPEQALIYRLSGDLNPLHIDPAAATAAGFPRPILHGLCSYGVAGRAVLGALCGNDPARLKRIGLRFSSPVFPGETIRTEIWREGDGGAAFRAVVPERGVTVLNNGFAEIS